MTFGVKACYHYCMNAEHDEIEQIVAEWVETTDKLRTEIDLLRPEVIERGQEVASAVSSLTRSYAAEDVEAALDYVLSTVRELRRSCDELEAQSIHLGRRCGMSWRVVGDALGVSRQAAMMRWSPRVDQMERGQLDAMTDPLF